jgi:transcriptional regulator with XRE-family HTH domain
MSNIKEILYKLIADRGVSPREVAKNAGISYHPIYAILKGTTTHPHKKTVKALAEYFDVTPAQLLGEEPLGDSAIRTTSDIGPYNMDFVRTLSRAISATYAMRRSNGEEEGRPITEPSPEEVAIIEGLSEKQKELLNLITTKYVQGNHLVIPISETEAESVVQIIAVLIVNELSEFSKFKAAEYKAEKKKGNRGSE